MRMTQKSACSPTRPPCAEIHVSPSCVLASLRPSTYGLGERLFRQAVGGAGEMVFASDKTLR